MVNRVKVNLMYIHLNVQQSKSSSHDDIMYKAHWQLHEGHIVSFG